MDEQKILTVCERLIDLTTVLVDEGKKSRQTICVIVLSVILAFTILGGICIGGYFFSSYEYYDVPDIQNSNYNENINRNGDG